MSEWRVAARCGRYAIPSLDGDPRRADGEPTVPLGKLVTVCCHFNAAFSFDTRL
jgi:hypothetical protein